MNTDHCCSICFEPMLDKLDKEQHELNCKGARKYFE